MSVNLKLLAVLLCSTTLTLALESNHIINSSGRSISTSDQLVSSVVLECFDGDEPFGRCVRFKVLEYLDNVSGNKRSIDQGEDDESLDNVIFERVQRYLLTHKFKFQLPDTFFQKAAITYRPSRSLTDFDVEFPPNPAEENRALSSETDGKVSNLARDMMKQKMILPLLMLIKLKLKVLIPILLALVHVKATKALILSKISFVLIVGYLVYQLIMKKNAMNMMAMPMDPSPATPLPYGPPSPTPTSSYGPPSTVSSYEAPLYDVHSSWEPASSSGGPYARVGWDSQSMAYNGYLPQQSSNQAATNNV